MSTSQAALRLAEDFNEPIGPSTIRLYESLGLIDFERTPRGERVVAERDLPRLARIARERRASQLAGLAAARAARGSRGRG
jgi:DNA-binding transcriptional MerR regulator